MKVFLMSRIFLFFLPLLLFANTQIYTYTVLLDYKEYVNSQVVDKDYTSFGELNGIGFSYTSNTYPLKFGIKVEFAYGKSTYEGATWSGIPIKNEQNGVYILNTNINIGNRFFKLSLGYREWNRGISEYVGDYNEVYYWGYFGIGFEQPFIANSFAFIPKMTYQYAINPKMKVELGNNPVLDLGDTDGYSIELPLYFRYKKTLIYLFYRYQYWHISPSKEAVLKIGNTVSVIYEPESETKNKYIGAGIVISF